MGFIRVRAELRALRAEIEELRNAIQDHTDAIHAAEERQRNEKTARNPIRALISYDEETLRSAKKESDRQHSTQEKIKDWARYAVIAAAIYAGIAAFQWYEMHNTTIATQSSANTALTQMDVTIRPWLGIEESTLQLAPSPSFMWPTIPNMLPTIQGTISLTIKNFGTSPGFRENFSTWIVPVDTSTPNSQSTPEPFLNQLCDMAARNPSGDTLFPGSTIQVHGGALYYAGAIKSTHLSLLWVVTCISYEDRRTKALHYTRYVHLSTHSPNAKPVQVSPSHPEWTYIPISGLYVWRTQAD